MSKTCLMGPSAARVIQRSCTFNGSDEYMTMAYGTTDNLNLQSLSFWMRPTNASSGCVLEIYGSTSGADNFFRVDHANQDLTFTLEINNVSVYTVSTSGDKLPTATWKHVVVAVSDHTSAESVLKVWVDGVKQTLSASTTDDSWVLAVYGGTPNFRFGANRAASSFFLGSLAEIIMGDVAISNRDTSIYPAANSNYIAAPDRTGLSNGGAWRPKPYQYGYVNVPYGFHLSFLDSASMGKDRSGLGNNFTLTNIDSTNQSTSVP